MNVVTLHICLNTHTYCWNNFRITYTKHSNASHYFPLMNLNFSFHSLVRIICPPTFQHSSAQFEITQELQLQTMWNLQMCIHSTAVMQVKFESYTGCVHSSFWWMSAGVTRLYISDSNAWPRGFWRFWCLSLCFSLSLCFYSAGIDTNIKC